MTTFAPLIQLVPANKREITLRRNIARNIQEYLARANYIGPPDHREGGMILHSSTSAVLGNAPINPDWILEGSPVARNHLIASSSDGLGSIYIWDCTAGKFNWHYGVDETVHILEGNVIVSDSESPAKRLGPGSVAFFAAGTIAHWHVENYVRKIAFCQQLLPTLLRTPIKRLRQAKDWVQGRTPATNLVF
jgi:uncharacterized cupin superfamily protein